MSEAKNAHDINVLMKAYDAATPYEKKLIAHLVRQKVANARSKPYEWNENTRALAAKYFHIQPVTPRGDFAAPSEMR